MTSGWHAARSWSLPCWMEFFTGGGCGGNCARAAGPATSRRAIVPTDMRSILPPEGIRPALVVAKLSHSFSAGVSARVVLGKSFWPPEANLLHARAAWEMRVAQAIGAHEARLLRSVFAFASLKLRRTRAARKGEAWWAVTDSNRRHSACKADALPTELTAQADPPRRDFSPRTGKAQAHRGAGAAAQAGQASIRYSTARVLAVGMQRARGRISVRDPLARVRYRRKPIVRSLP